MRSDDSVDEVSNPKMNIGGFSTPPPARDYDGLMSSEKTPEATNTDNIGNQRWICSSCDFNNRPHHKQCKVCKTKRTKYMKTVSEDEYRALNTRTTQKKQKGSEKIQIGGGNMNQIPTRNYDEMLHSESATKQNVVNGTSNYITAKPPLIEYLGKENDTKSSDSKNHKGKEPEVVASGVDPEMIPQRDYDQMLNATEIDDTAAFIPSETELPIPSQDVMTESIDINTTNLMDLTNSTTQMVPQRNYESMLNASDPIYDAEQEQQQLIEQMTQQFVAQKKKENDESTAKLSSYRSTSAVVPQRNYDAMMKKQSVDSTPNNLNHSVSSKSKVVTSSTGHWVCSNPECEHLNRATRTDCSVCHAVKPSYKRTAQLLDDGVDQLGLDHRWVCKNCNGLNKGSRSKCVYCKEAKSYDPKSKNAARKQMQSTKRRKIQGNGLDHSGGGIFQDAERWVCPNAKCNFLNKGSRIQCQVCKTQRKDQSVLWGDRTVSKSKENESGNGNGKGTKDTEINKTTGSGSGGSGSKKFVHPLEAKMMGGSVDTNMVNMQWNCAMCTFSNRFNASKCEMCGCPKDAH